MLLALPCDPGSLDALLCIISADMNAYDAEVSSWFEIPLLSPLAATSSHGYAVATGDPNSMLHIFASGELFGHGDACRFKTACSCIVGANGGASHGSMLPSATWLG